MLRRITRIKTINNFKLLPFIILFFSCAQVPKTVTLKTPNYEIIDNSAAIVLPTLNNDSLVIKNRKLYMYFTDSLDFFNNVTQFQKIAYSLSLCDLKDSICDSVIFKINMPNRIDGNMEASDSYQNFLAYKNIYSNGCIKTVFDEIFDYESFDPDYRILNSMNTKFGYSVYGEEMIEKAFCGVDLAVWLMKYINEKKHNRFGPAHVVVDIYESAILKLDENERDLHLHMFSLFKTCIESLKVKTKHNNK